MTRILLVSSNITTDPFPVYPLGLAVIASALVGCDHTVDQFDFLVAGKSEVTLPLSARRPRWLAMAPS